MSYRPGVGLKAQSEKPNTFLSLVIICQSKVWLPVDKPRSWDDVEKQAWTNSNANPWIWWIAIILHAVMNGDDAN